MEVCPAAERVDQVLVGRQVREQAQFDLGVVGRQEALAFRQRHEAGADLAAELGAHGDVLEVRIRRGQAAGGGDRLVERGVHAPVARAQARQRVDVGRLDLGELAVAQDERRHLVLGGQLLEHTRVGGVAALVLLARLEAEHLEQDVRELLGRVEVELLPRDPVDARGQPVELALRGLAEALEVRGVDGGARALHDREHRDERQVDVAVGCQRPVALERALERFGETARRGGLGGGEHVVVLGLGQDASHVRVEQRVVGVRRHRRVEDVAGKPQVERVHGHEVRVVDERGKRRVGGIDAVQLGLDIERRERALAHDPRERGKPLVVDEQSGALLRVDGEADAGAEQRLLLGRDEGDAHARALSTRLVDQAQRVPARQDGFPLQRRDLLGGLLAHQLQHARQMGVEAHRAERRRDLVDVERREARVLDVEREVQIAHDCRHAAADVGGVLVLLEVLELLALELVEVLVDAVDAPVSRKQARRALVADAGHAGDVVGAVAFEAQEIGELRGRHPVALLDLGGAVDRHVGDALFGGDDAGEVARQLVSVLVAGDEQRLVAELLVARRDGAQNVVALPALHAHDRHVHGLEQALDDRELHLEVLVHRRALRLVLLERLHAERRAARIERADDGVGGCDLDELEEHRDEAEHRVGGRAVGGVHRGRHRMVGAVHERVSVDDGDLSGHRASSPSRFPIA